MKMKRQDKMEQIRLIKEKAIGQQKILKRIILKNKDLKEKNEKELLKNKGGSQKKQNLNFIKVKILSQDYVTLFKKCQLIFQR